MTEPTSRGRGRVKGFKETEVTKARRRASQLYAAAIIAQAKYEEAEVELTKLEALEAKTNERFTAWSDEDRARFIRDNK